MARPDFLRAPSSVASRFQDLVLIVAIKTEMAVTLYAAILVLRVDKNPAPFSEPSSMKKVFRLFCGPGGDILSSHDEAREFCLVRNHHAQGAIRLDYIDPLHIDYIELFFFVFVGGAHHEKGDD
jgi:hypothetical protein